MSKDDCDNLKKLIKELEDKACQCDMMLGFTCDVHQIAGKAVTLLENAKHECNEEWLAKTGE